MGPFAESRPRPANCFVAQVSKPAVSPISKSARQVNADGQRVGKPATQQTWKSALRRSVKLCAAIMTSLVFAAAANAAEKLPLDGAEQLLVVTTKDWSSVPATMKRYERKDASSPWRRVGAAIPVVLGRNGLGWGRGLNPAVSLPGPVKKEGDGKSPAGVFALGSAFGLEETVKGMKLPYQRLTGTIECVDDAKSEHYNSIVDREHAGTVDWNSSEKMQSVGECYRLGVVVEHNADPREAGGGSCVFLHIWKSPTTPTSGCTAMERSEMEKVALWLDPAKHPALAQLPETEYKQLQKDWQLPIP
jgi:D-alanyl-D-alanine dipeptidase